MTRRSLFFAFAAFVATSAAACGGDDGADSITGPSPTGTAPFSVTDLVVGTGAAANAGQAVTVTYTGWLYSNTAAENKGDQFDASTTPVRFQLGAGVIAGWSQGIPGMRVGGTRRLVIPPELAYGSTSPDLSRIPRNATLLFDVTLVSVP
jgi:FKBP-type peptidyl-prolyl cis-trans isomerase FkpA